MVVALASWIEVFCFVLVESVVELDRDGSAWELIASCVFGVLSEIEVKRDPVWEVVGVGDGGDRECGCDSCEDFLCWSVVFGASLELALEPVAFDEDVFSERVGVMEDESVGCAVDFVSVADPVTIGVCDEWVCSG